MSGYHKRGLDTFPMHTIKRCDRPTTIIHDDEVNRVDERDSGFNKAAAGSYGPTLAVERPRFVMKHPLSGALGAMQLFLREIVDGMAAQQKAPLPEDPAAPGPSHQGDGLFPQGRCCRYLQAPALRRLHQQLPRRRTGGMQP